MLSKNPQLLGLPNPGSAAFSLLAQEGRGQHRTACRWCWGQMARFHATHGPFTWAVRGAVADMEDFTKKDAAFTIKNGGFVGFCASNMMIPSDFGDLTNKMAGLSIQNGDLTSKLRDRTGISLDAKCPSNKSELSNKGVDLSKDNGNLTNKDRRMKIWY
jgi:hypothetical protein